MPMGSFRRAWVLIDDETDHRRLPGRHEPPEAISHSSREHPVSEVCSGDHALAGKIRKVVRINQTRRERLVVDDARTAAARRGVAIGHRLLQDGSAEAHPPGRPDTMRDGDGKTGRLRTRHRQP